MSLIITAAVAAYGWIVSPHVAYLRAARRYEPAVMQAADEKSALCRALGAKRRRLQRLQDELRGLRDRCFTAESAQTFFGDMEDLCRQAGCEMVSVEFHYGDERRAPQSQGLAAVLACGADLVVHGQYDQIVALLERVQDRPQQVYVDSCCIDLVDARSDQFRGELNLGVLMIRDTSTPMPPSIDGKERRTHVEAVPDQEENVEDQGAHRR